ncbi:hypothetical protein OF83DRAFT_1178188 [Amylostereum chailletii]|nr:hypothetical protein OF83DRAFT_1178188 [Amylostereum chailletii]
MAGVTFRIDEAYLVGAWCAAALWGIFTCLVAFALWQIVQLNAKREMTRSKYITAVAVVVLYGLSTAHISLALRRLIIGFIDNQGPSTLPYFADIGLPLNRAKDLLYINSMIIADTVVVWRCYIVWAKNKLVLALPVLLIFGTITAGYGAILQYFLSNPNPEVAASFGEAMFAVSLTTNAFVTLLTVGRIWQVPSPPLTVWIAHSISADLAAPFQSTYRTVLLLLIESGLFISVTKLIEFVLYQKAPGDGLTGFNALYIIFEIIPHINGIMPTLIIIVVNAGKTMTDTQSSTMRTSRAVSSGLVFAPPKLRPTVTDPQATETKDTYMQSQISDNDKTHAFALGIGGESTSITHHESGDSRDGLV